MNISTTTAEKPDIKNLDQLVLQSKALTAIDCGIMITDHKGYILWVNPAFSKSTGYPAEEILGKTPKIFKSGNHDKSYYSQFWDTVLSGDTWRGQFVNRRRDGSICVHSQTTTPVRWQNPGPITHFISVNEDITKGGKSKVDSRDIPNLDVLGELAAGIAHHFNNLLTIIHSNSELLLGLNGGLHPDGGILVERTLAASRRAEHLIRQLIGFSQKQAFEFQALDLNRVAEHAVRLFHPQAKNIVEWDCYYSGDLPFVLADSGMLSQMISNLLINALDAMPQGGRLTLTTERFATAPGDMGNRLIAKPGEFVCLTICDTGCGISPANLPRIFEPFFTTKDAAGHSGLGLALVYGIVKQHQGWMEINSQVGRGTTFKIFLPAITKSYALASGALPRHELPGLFEQPLSPPDMATETDASAAIPANQDDGMVWVNPALFSSNDTIAFPPQLAKVAPSDMNELIRDVVTMLRRLLDKSIEVEFEESFDAVWARADVCLVEQAIMNLCIHARDAMPKGGRLTLAATMVEIQALPARPNPDARPGRFVCLTVSHTGCGMDKAILGNVFDPSFSTKESGNGTGLGLATVYGIVKQHGGWVEVDSEAGSGGSFRVYLPGI